MEVLVGPTTFSIEVSPSSSAESASLVGSDHDHESSSAKKTMPSCLFLKEEEEDINETPKGNFGSGCSSFSSSSSSIGAPDDSDENEEEDDAVSSAKTVQKTGLSGSFGCLSSLEDSLPIKRGLSSHYTGKSKSFANLLDMSSSCTSMKDLVKPENPFNKRRRVLMANNWSRKSSSFYSWQNPKSMPLLTSLDEEEHHHQDHDQDDGDDDDPSATSSSSEDKDMMRSIPKLYTNTRKLKASGFKTCFSLADLHEHEEHHQ